MGSTIKFQELTTQITSILRRLTSVEFSAQKSFYSIFLQPREISVSLNLGIISEVSATYADIDGMLVDVDFDNWDDFDWYFDVVAKATSGETFVQIYNVDDTAIITGSEISTTNTSYNNIRSTKLTKLTGTKTLKIQIKNVGGGTSNLSICRFVFRSPLSN